MGIVRPSGGGGYTAPTARAQYSGGVVVGVANGADANLTWNSLDLGTELLDRTDPANPTVITAGIYTVAAVCQGNNLTVGGYLLMTLALDQAGDDLELLIPSPVAAASQASPQVALTASYYLPAAAIVQVRVGNRDGAAARNFQLLICGMQRIA